MQSATYNFAERTKVGGREKKNQHKAHKLIRVGLWQNGFFADFTFEPPDFLADFVAGLGIFSHFCVKKCPEKASRKILQNLCNKNLRHISAEGLGQHKHFSDSPCGQSSQGQTGTCPSDKWDDLPEERGTPSVWETLAYLLSSLDLESGKVLEKAHQHKQIWGIVPGLGG